ncbi:S-layer protein [Blastopirellula sp. JC732]|uniref:S-layer protein n=1 Tax=Blastopirellula sediminis TaxID=2894196 RepID=A0A9X1SIR8_9BACT|nr:S-layer protein [Blastopirellula sediminis]MCC9605128.1 S-layer protein [Blastopirellula sediminis]MCC9631572.1 S-layer protein [Blastopirellula sediminis]
MVLSLNVSAVNAADYELAFSTYLGGKNWEHARDICVDQAGNVYVVGGTVSDDFPTTEQAFQRKQDKTGDKVSSGGYCDAFVCKFSPEGRLLWSTLLGGPNYDRAYAVEVGVDGSVYVAERGGPGFPVTEGAFQTTFQGAKQSIYGMQNGFVVKLKPDGSDLDWAAYVGTNWLCRDLAIDETGDVYLPLDFIGSGPMPPASWFGSAYQKQPSGGAEVGALKVAGDGKSVLWATWFGGSKDEVANCGIRVDPEKNVFLNFTTDSPDVPTTDGAHDRTHHGKHDAFIAKLSPDGRKLIYGTYFGGSGEEEGNSTHNLAVDSSGNAYLATSTTSHDLPVTRGAFQAKHAGGERDVVVAKFSPAGALIGCTYIGGTANDGIDGVDSDDQGNVFFTGSTSSRDFPTTDGALQAELSVPDDAILVVLSADFAQLNFSTLMGGSNYDSGRCGCLDQQGNLYVSGSVNGPGWPLKNAYQPQFAGGGGGQELCYKGGCYAGDVIIAKFQKRSE